MTDKYENDNEPEQGADSGGTIEVGERLRKAREEADIDINEMAGRLRLTSSQLEDIEAGRLDQFGASIYARGYVANYARLLGLRVEPLMEQLDMADDEPPLKVTTAGPAAGQRLAENIARVATYAVGTVVLALPVLWWASEGSLDALFGEPSVVSAQAESAESGVDADEPVTERDREPERTPEDDAERKRDDEPLMASMGMMRSSRDKEPEPVEAAAVESETVTEPVPDRLVLEMHGDSWVEIRDSAGSRLEYDLLEADTTHEYTGSAPYRVLIGNAEGVSVRYNGEPVETAPFVQGNLARFEVGEEPAGG
jgi:cytoskeleton protein RodZ